MPWTSCWWTCSWTAVPRRRRLSCTWTARTFRCVGSRRSDSSTATTGSTASCRFWSYADARRCWRGCARRPNMGPPGRRRTCSAGGADPRTLAAQSHHPAHRFRLLPGADPRLVRERWRRVRDRPGPQPPSAGSDRARDAPIPIPGRDDRPAVAAFPLLLVARANELVTPAPGGGQGRSPAGIEPPGGDPGNESGADADPAAGGMAGPGVKAALLRGRGIRGIV